MALVTDPNVGNVDERASTRHAERKGWYNTNATDATIKASSPLVLPLIKADACELLGDEDEDPHSAPLVGREWDEGPFLLLERLLSVGLLEL